MSQKGNSPMHQGGRTLAKMSRKGGSGGGANKKKRATWAENGGIKYPIEHLTKGRIRLTGETPPPITKQK
jgi:hypothetical protein